MRNDSSMDNEDEIPRIIDITHNIAIEININKNIFPLRLKFFIEMSN